MCVQTNATMEDEDRFKFDGEEYYVKSSEEMRLLFPDDSFPNACDNTIELANRLTTHLNSIKIIYQISQLKIVR